MKKIDKQKSQDKLNFTYDIQLLFPVLLLVGVGIVMVYSASSEVALKKFSSDYYFLKRQGIFAVAGIVSLVICRHFPYRFFRPLVYPMLAVVCLLLIGTHLPGFGLSAGGASRWLKLGPFSFQPSEAARFVLVIYLAYSMNAKLKQIKLFSVGIVPHFIVCGVLAALIALQPDFGSVMILGMVTFIMLFVGGVRLLHLGICLSTLIPLAVWFVFQAEYRLKRLLSFLDPWQYPASDGYQIIHSLMAFGTGGIFGTGIGKGYQKLFYLPEPHTDFIFSVIGEELGVIGVLFILALYGIVIWRGIGIARSCKDPFGSFIACGLTVTLSLQICINMGVTLGLLPTKGLTLPFLSYGGTSLLFSMASIGILMNIGEAKKNK